MKASFNLTTLKPLFTSLVPTLQDILLCLFKHIHTRAFLKKDETNYIKFHVHKVSSSSWIFLFLLNMPQLSFHGSAYRCYSHQKILLCIRTYTFKQLLSIPFIKYTIICSFNMQLVSRLFLVGDIKVLLHCTCSGGLNGYSFEDGSWKSGVVEEWTVRQQSQPKMAPDFLDKLLEFSELQLPHLFSVGNTSCRNL